MSKIHKFINEFWTVGDFRAFVSELPLCRGGLDLGHPLFVQSAWCFKFCSFPSDITGLGLCGEFSHGDPETGSLFSQPDPVCYLAFQEDEAFREGELHVSECYLTGRVQL